MTAILWFRRDLRIEDHPALHAAAQAGTVLPLFVLDPTLLRGRWSSPNRTTFLLATLRELDTALRERGARLHVRLGDPAREVPRFASEVGAREVFVSRDYTPYARRRDAAIARALESLGIRFHARRGILAHEPEEVRGADGQPLSVFTRFFRAWQMLPLRQPLAPPDRIPMPADQPDPGEIPTPPALGLPSAVEGLPPAGESAARARLASFLAGPVCRYADQRDRLDLAGTSRISQDLHFGLLSPVEIILRARSVPCNTTKFVAEIAWREFYHYIVWHHPRVLREPFQQAFSALPWRNDPEAFEAWAAGRTGYPLVDAAMRELAATGYIHNRARMVVASFLTKDLLLDWRLGETHFMHHLVDGDVANNDGGWQWAASVGTDAPPYFRIFNPVAQSKKFDPDAAYIRRWLPELRHVPVPYVHEPWTMPAAVQEASRCIIGRDYPAPIVDHAGARARALATFEAARRAARKAAR